MVLWVVTGDLYGAGIDLEMHTMVESTDLSWRAVGMSRMRGMGRVGERMMQGVPTGEAAVWG